MTTERAVRRALILEGGGAKGAYAFGCLLALAERKIEFDVVAGTSVGALNAVCWSANAFAEGESLWRALGPLSLIRLRPVIAAFIATLFFPWLLPVLLLLAIALFLTLLGREYFIGQLWTYARIPAIGFTAFLSGAMFVALYFGFRQSLVPSAVFALLLPLMIVSLTEEESSFGEVLTLAPILTGTLYTIAALIVIVGDIDDAPSFVRRGLTLGPLISSPYFLYKLANRVAILSSGRLRTLAEPILARGLRTPTFACSARLARMIDPDHAVLGKPGQLGFIEYSERRMLSYVPCYDRLDDKPSSLAMESLLASAALPLGLFRSRRVGGSSRLDGGLAANLPLGAVLPFSPTEVYIVKLRPWDGDLGQFISYLEKEAQLPLMEELSKAIGVYLVTDPKPIRKAVQEAYGMLLHSRKVYALPQRFVVLAPANPLGGFFTGTLRFQRKYIDRLIRSGRDDTLAYLSK